MAKTLTAKSVENIKPLKARYEIPDAGCRGLYLVTQPSSAKSWALRFRLDGKPCKHTLGSWPAVTLAEARRLAAAAMAQVAHGADPRTEKRKAKAEAVERGQDTVERLAAQFLNWQEKRLRPNSLRQLHHIFDDLVSPAWQGRDVHGIKRRDVIELVEGVAKDRPIMANRTLQGLSKFFNWLCERDVIAASPCAGVAPPSPEHARDRVLSDHELVALWQACDTVGEPACSCIRMLMLLGQRRSETAGMRRSEIDGDLWRLPAERMKGRQIHMVPLPARAMAIIEAMPQGDLIFTVSGKAPMSHFDRIKREIDAHMKPAAPWCWHDIRRSTASGMAGLGVPVPTIEKILAHRSGTFRGIVGTYQRHSFIPEMRSALERWSEHLDRLVQGVPAAKVVPIGTRGTNATASIFDAYGTPLATIAKNLIEG
jgi:integrase